MPLPQGHRQPPLSVDGSHRRRRQVHSATGASMRGGDGHARSWLGPRGGADPTGGAPTLCRGESGSGANCVRTKPMSSEGRRRRNPAHRWAEDARSPRRGSPPLRGRNHALVEPAPSPGLARGASSSGRGRDPRRPSLTAGRRSPHPSPLLICPSHRAPGAGVTAPPCLFSPMNDGSGKYSDVWIWITVVAAALVPPHVGGGGVVGPPRHPTPRLPSPRRPPRRPGADTRGAGTPPRGRPAGCSGTGCAMPRLNRRRRAAP